MSIVTKVGARRRVMSWPVFGLTLGALIAGAGVARAAAPVLPTGGKVVSGSAAIGPAGAGGLTVTQSSAKAILDWSSFSIGSGGKVAFDNGSGATLNRVTGPQVSSLDGLLTGTGSVYLINPNGVIIGRSGVVDVGGTFVASTLDTSDAGFLKGGALGFTGASTAQVINFGKVGALGGDVALIAAEVSNAGSITAANGSAGLIAGHSVVMLRDGALDEGRFSVLLGGADTSATNTGLIQAANAELRAEGGNVYALAGDTSGVIRATGVKSGGGKVWLVAEGGELDLSGAIIAQGADATAGWIETSGGTVKIGGARIDAHGGTWLVDPYDLTIDQTAANTIDNALNVGTSVIEQTTASGYSGVGMASSSGEGDIIVAAPIDWSTNASLTLSAYQNIFVNSPVTIAGGGALTLITDNSSVGNGGTLYFNSPAQFTGLKADGQPAGALSIGVGGATSTSYMLVADLPTLSAAVSSNNLGAYALATDVDGDNGGDGYTGVPLASTVTTPFAGKLEGLGNHVQNLTISDDTDPYVGLLSQVGPSGSVRDISITNGRVSQSPSQSGQAYAVGAVAGLNSGVVALSDFRGNVFGVDSTGGLIGVNRGAVTSGFVIGSVSGIGITGGVVGSNFGHVRGVFYEGTVYDSPDKAGVGYAGGLVGLSESVGGASAAVEGFFDGRLYASGYVGGLAGYNGKSASLSGGLSANSSVQGAGEVGGAAGYNDGVITGVQSAAYVSGSVYAQAPASVTGGLVGLNDTSGVISGSSSSGLIGGTSNAVGGLVGSNEGQVGSLGLAANFTTGVTQIYGQTGVSAGGLVGLNSGSIVNGYASGLVNDAAASTDAGRDFQGGLVGSNTGSIAYAYALDEVAASQQDTAGGLVGDNAGSISQAYAIGHVHGGSGKMGGLAGANSGTISAAYYDQVTTQQSQAVGVDGGSTAAVAVGGTGPDPYGHATYGGLDFGAGGWFMAEGATRPILQAEASSLIANAHQLELIALDPGGDYVQTNNIEFALPQGAFDVFNPAVGFAPIGSGGHTPVAFTGSYDGGDNYISDLVINSVGPSVGLFAVNAGTIQNLGLSSAQITGTAAASAYGVGTIAGENDGLLQNISSLDGRVTGIERVGGLVGTNKGTIDSSYDGDVVGGHAMVGGLAAYNTGTISASDGLGQAEGTSKDAYEVGGVVGVNLGLIQNDRADFQPSLSQDQNALGVSGDHQVGGVAGYNGGMITGSYASSSVGGGSGKLAGTTQASIGGLVGENVGRLVGDTATGSVSGFTQVGGLVGLNDLSLDFSSASIAPGSLSNDTASGAVTGHTQVGGLVGRNDGFIDSSSASGAVSGYSQVGGLIGYSSGDGGDGVTYTVSNSYATGDVAGASGKGAPSGAGGQIGGLIGESAALIIQTYATGTVSGLDQVGGLIGKNDDERGEVRVSYATGAVEGDAQKGAQIGGLVGYNGGLIADTYATGAVSGASGKGGLVGTNAQSASINTSYATGSGGYGFVGNNNGTLTSDVFDAGTTNTTVGVGSGPSAGLTAIGGSTGLDPDNASSYAGFDFTDIWTIAPGSSRPYLQAAPQSPPPS